MTPEKTSITEKLTSPLGRALTAGITTAGTLALANKALGSRGSAKLFARFGKKPVQIKGRNIAGAASGSALLSGIFANPERSIYADSIIKRLQRGGKGFTRTEKRLLGVKDGTFPALKGKSLSEHYFSPSSMGGFRGVVGGLLGGFSPLAVAEGAATGVAGTAFNKELLARAFRNRMKSGRNLNSRERRLAAMLRGQRRA